mgnify:CR=1 FL=1
MEEIIKEYGHIIISTICVCFVLVIVAYLFLSDDGHLFSSIEAFIRNTYGG